HHIDWVSAPRHIPIDGIPIVHNGIDRTNEPWHFKLIGFFSHDFVYLIFTIGLSFAIRMSEIWSKLEKEQAAMNVERKDRELANLKSQLNPHFLFNTLNNIYALISIDQHKAQRAVHELSQLLRYMLYENKEKTIPLESELRFVKNYIELMKLRLTSNTKLTVNVIETDGVGLQIAPFMFISIVENAFKHGVFADKPSFVDIAITVAASTVKCVVKNSYFPQKKSGSEASGIGIENLKKQISILYPNRHTFEVINDNSTYTTILEIKL
ncbi:MAG: sensor histidine kinase, partial [Muribaculaceae bacterium]